MRAVRNAYDFCVQVSDTSALSRGTTPASGLTYFAAAPSYAA
jgi:hypothetical protein